MPWVEQLFDIWETDFEHWGGSGQPLENYRGSAIDGGMTTEKGIDTPMVRKFSLNKFDGRVIGRYVYNSDTDDFKIVLDKPEK